MMTHSALSAPWGLPHHMVCDGLYLFCMSECVMQQMMPTCLHTCLHHAADDAMMIIVVMDDHKWMVHGHRWCVDYPSGLKGYLHWCGHQE